MDTDTRVALGDMPSRSERIESGKLAISIAQLVRQGRMDDWHLLLSGMTIRELALCLGSLGALSASFADCYDNICVGQGLPALSGDVMRQWLNLLETLPVSGDPIGCEPWSTDDHQIHD
jgi:hypothetical protein